MDYNKLALELHGNTVKITTTSEIKEELNRTTSAYYSPGVGAVGPRIAENPADLPKYTDEQRSCRNFRRLSNFGIRHLGPKSRHASYGRKIFAI